MIAVRSIRLKITLLTCGLITAAVVAFAIASYQAVRERAEMAAQQRLQDVSRELASNIGGSVARIREQVSRIASHPAVVAHLGDPAQRQEEARLALSGLTAEGAAESLTPGELRDADGRRILDTGHPLPSAEDDLDHEIQALMDGNAAVAVVPFRVLSDTLVSASFATVAPEGELLGYVIRWHRSNTTRRSLELIQDMVGVGTSVYLVNAEGDLWTDMNRPVEGPGVDLSAIAGQAIQRTPDGSRSIFATAEVPGAPWMLVVQVPLNNVLEGPRQLVRSFLFVGLFLVFAAAFIAWFLSGRLTRTVEQLASAAAAVSRGDYTRRVDVSGADELETLATAFNAMTDDVAAAQEQLQTKVMELAASEEQNRKTRERLEYVITSSQAILYRAPAQLEEAGFHWISENVTRLLGYSVGEALAPGWWRENIHPDDHEFAVAGRAGFDVDGERTREYRFRDAAGHYRWIRDEQRLLRATDGSPREIVGFFTDVTEHHSLELAKAEAEAASWAKNEFLSRMSHELRTPLTAVLGFGQLLHLDVEDQEQRESVDQILKAGRHLLALVDEVLDIARIEAGRMSLSVEPVFVPTVIQESIDLVRITAEQNGIDLRSELDGESDLYVAADQQRLKQVMLNLLSNAIKYNRRNGTVTVSCRALDDEQVQITVEDTGTGLTPAQMERLFTPFDRLGAEAGGSEGTGLGLALSKGLVEAMSGRIAVESRPGVGTRFRIELPIARFTEPEADLPESAGQEPATDATETVKTVLFVEDNLANVRLMERVLQRRPGIQLLTAVQASVGLDLAREHRPDLILLDLNLPDISGDELLLQLRAEDEFRDTPIIMVSGDATPARAERLLSLGAHAYITKPFNIQMLLEMVAHFLGRGASTAEE